MSIKIAIYIGLSLLAALIGVDIYLAADNVKDNTWSEIIRAWSKHTPIIPWICGVLTGHFFHPTEAKAILGQPSSVALLIWITAVVGIFGISFLRFNMPIPAWSVLIPAFIAGWLLWPV